MMKSTYFFVVILLVYTWLIFFWMIFCVFFCLSTRIYYTGVASPGGGWYIWEEELDKSSTEMKSLCDGLNRGT